MKVKFCPCLLSACSPCQMKWDEGTDVSESTESSSKWQFKHYLFSCSNWIIWLGKMGPIILAILLPRLRHGGLRTICLYCPWPSRSNLFKGLFLFLILAPGFVLPYHLVKVISGDFGARRTNISRKNIICQLVFQ